MGRGMFITAIGATIIFGMVQLGLANQKKMIIENAAEYANKSHARNTAFTAIQLAMEQINQDENWAPTKGSPWKINIDKADISLYYDLTGVGSGTLDSDTLIMYSTSNYFGDEATIISTFTRTSLDFVPEFKSAMSFATKNFNFSAGGSSVINGNDASGTCVDKPAVAVLDQPSANEVSKTTDLVIFNSSNAEHFESSVNKVAIDPSLSYQPVDELIARLASSPGTVNIEGVYKGEFGTAENPGVFFVTEQAKLSGGISEGFGILVIRSGGLLEYEGGIELAGNFKFNGLIVFENAFDMTGRGTPDLKGSVLVGNTNGNNSRINVDISGNVNIQYDCSSEAYAKAASARLLKQSRFIRLRTFE